MRGPCLMPSLAQRLADATRQLEAVTETPRLDAEMLLAHALGMPRATMLARLREELAAPGFEVLLARGLDFEPIAYITGTWEFFSLDFLTHPPILVPRPETEHLVEVGLEFLDGLDGARQVLDLGTGTGCVAISIARNAPGCSVTATDVNGEALGLARENADRCGTAIGLREGDLFDALLSEDGPFDLVVSNPPYVEEGEWDCLSPVIRRHEDRGALLAGEDGLAIIRRIIGKAPEHMKPGALLALEHGEKHDARVASLLEERGFTEVGHRSDLAGIPRITFGRWTRPAH